MGPPGGARVGRLATTGCRIVEQSNDWPRRVRVNAPLSSAAMRLVIARCSVDYVGRLSARLEPATRLVIVKADGSVLVHSDAGGYKPLNWMSAPCSLFEEDGCWRVTNKSGETMTIAIEEILEDWRCELGTDPGLVKDGVEKHLQALLADQCHVLG